MSMSHANNHSPPTRAVRRCLKKPCVRGIHAILIDMDFTCAQMAKSILQSMKQRNLTTSKQFVQMLSNPLYLQHLASQKLLDNEDFIAYLSYLQYFREPKYLPFLMYVPNLLTPISKSPRSLPLSINPISRTINIIILSGIQAQPSEPSTSSKKSVSAKTS